MVLNAAKVVFLRCVNLSCGRPRKQCPEFVMHVQWRMSSIRAFAREACEAQQGGRTSICA